MRRGPEATTARGRDEQERKKRRHHRQGATSASRLFVRRKIGVLRLGRHGSVLLVPVSGRGDFGVMVDDPIARVEQELEQGVGMGHIRASTNLNGQERQRQQQDELEARQASHPADNSKVPGSTFMMGRSIRHDTTVTHLVASPSILPRVADRPRDGAGRSIMDAMRSGPA
jgi:hypothetical protein